MKKFPAYILGSAIVSLVLAVSGTMSVRELVMTLMLLATLGLVVYSVAKLTQETA